MKRQVKKKKRVSMIYLAEMSIEQGLSIINAVLNMSREKLIINGQIVLRDKKRFAVLRSCELKCFQCGVKATHFIVEKHRNDFVMPFQLNVYAGNHLLTWDHILPKSLEGSDDPINARAACTKCNSSRGNEMTITEMVWAATQDPNRIYRNTQHPKLSLSEIIRLESQNLCIPV